MDISQKDKGLINKVRILIMFVTTIALVFIVDIYVYAKEDNNKIAILLLFCLLFFSMAIYYMIEFSKLNLTKEKQRILFLTYEIGMIACVIAIQFQYIYLPIWVMALIIAVLVNKNLGLIFNLYVSLIFALLSYMSLQSFVFYIVLGSGVVMIGEYVIVSKYRIYVLMVYVSIAVTTKAIISFYFLNSIQYEELIMTAAVIMVYFILFILIYSIIEKKLNKFKYFDEDEMEECVNMIMKQMNAKSNILFQHSKRVYLMTLPIAEKLNLDTTIIKIGSLTHDIGKMSKQYLQPASLISATRVKEIIDNKMGDAKEADSNLDMQIKEKEMLMKEHIEQGVLYAQELGFPQIIIDIIRLHHDQPITKEMAVIAIANEIDMKVCNLKPGTNTIGNICNIISLVVMHYIENKNLEQLGFQIEEMKEMTLGLKQYYLNKMKKK